MTFHLPQGFILGKENSHVLYQISCFVEEAKITDQPLKSILIVGMRGIGKTTIAQIYGSHASSFEEKSSDYLSNIQLLSYTIGQLSSKSAILVDEIHKLKHSAEELGLYMLNPSYDFTVIGATTRADQIVPSLRSRFSAELRLLPYSTETLARIAKHHMKELEEESALYLAKISDGTPRHLILKLITTLRAHLVSTRQNQKSISIQDIKEFLQLIKIDEEGLEEIHRDYIRSIAEYPFGASLNTLASKLALPKGEIENDIEQRLIKKGFVEISSRGRVLIGKGMEYHRKIKDTQASGVFTYVNTVV